MKIPYERIKAPENLRKNRWILKTFGVVTILILLALAAFTFVRINRRCRVKVSGQYLECGSQRLFLCGSELRENVLLLSALEKEISQLTVNQPYPRPPPSAELMKVIDQSAFAFELKCQQLVNSGGNLLNWELEIPFDPELKINPLELMGIRALLDIAQKYDLFVVLSLTSSASMNESAKDGLAYSDIDRYIASVIIPIVRALKGHPSLLAISPLDTADELLDYVDLDDICTDLTVLETGLHQRQWHSGLTIRMVQYFVAKVAEIVHTVDPEELVTVVSSTLVSVKPVGHPGFFSDMCLEKACLGCDLSKATLDFYMPASFGVESGNSMPSVPFMSRIDKPIILAFNPADELELLDADIEALPKTLKDIGFSGFFLQAESQRSLADDLRVNEKAAEAGLENLEDVELFDGDAKIEEDFGDVFQNDPNTFVQEMETADGRKIVVEGEPRDDVYGPVGPIITSQDLLGSEEEEEEEGEKDIPVVPEPRGNIQEIDEEFVIKDKENDLKGQEESDESDDKQQEDEVDDKVQPREEEEVKEEPNLSEDVEKLEVEARQIEERAQEEVEIKENVELVGGDEVLEVEGPQVKEVAQDEAEVKVKTEHMEESAEVVEEDEQSGNGKVETEDIDGAEDDDKELLELLSWLQRVKWGSSGQVVKEIVPLEDVMVKCA